VSLLRGRGELAGQRTVPIGGHQRVVRPGVLVGRGRRLDGLPARGGQADHPGRDRIQRRPPGDVVIAKPEHLGHAITYDRG